MTDIVGVEIVYKSESINLQGYIAYDKTIKDKRPGILVVHKWWDHNKFAKTKQPWKP